MFFTKQQNVWSYIPFSCSVRHCCRISTHKQKKTNKTKQLTSVLLSEQDREEEAVEDKAAVHEGIMRCAPCRSMEMHRICEWIQMKITETGNERIRSWKACIWSHFKTLVPVLLSYPDLSINFTYWEDLIPHFLPLNKTIYISRCWIVLGVQPSTDKSWTVRKDLLKTSALDGLPVVGNP